MLKKLKKAAQKVFVSGASSAEDDALQGLQDVLKQQEADKEQMLAVARRAKAQADEMTQHMEELQAMGKGSNNSDNIGFLPGSFEDKLARVKETVQAGRREIFAKDGGVVSVETTEPVTAMRPLRFKSRSGVTA